MTTREICPVKPGVEAIVELSVGLSPGVPQVILDMCQQKAEGIRNVFSPMRSLDEVAQS